MSRPARAFITRAVLLISVLTGLAAGQTKLVPGPIPTQITTAKKVFIANAGGDEPGIDEPIFSGGVDRSYNQFYAAMKSAGRYDIVGSLAEPDLLFEIRFTVNTTPTRVFKGDSIGASLDPQFRLEIRDPRTSALLWAFTEHVQWAILQGNRDKNFDQASARIVADVLALAARAVAVTTPANP